MTRNPRRRALEALRRIVRQGRAVQAPWNLAMTTFDTELPWNAPDRIGGPGQCDRPGGWRPRRPEELPEYSAEAWDHLADAAEVLVQMADQLRAFALAQAAECRRVQAHAADSRPDS